MKSPNTIESEIDRIRLQIYEETKDMTSGQIVDYYSRSTKAAVREMGYELIVINPEGHMRLVKIQQNQKT